MTARQEKYQDPIKWSSDDNQWFEALALRTIEQTPIHAWGNAIALWRWLPLAWPSTRDRILRRLLEVATKRSDPWPAPLVRRFAEAAIPAFNPAGARGRIHDKEAFEKAARYVAHHPRASERQIANAAQTSRENIRQWPDLAREPIFDRVGHEPDQIESPGRKAGAFSLGVLALLGRGEPPTVVLDYLAAGPADSGAVIAQRDRRFDFAGFDQLIDAGMAEAEILLSHFGPENLVRV